jgi:hypothetical protein
LSKYDPNLNSFNSKKYIDNVKKVCKADIMVKGTNSVAKGATKAVPVLVTGTDAGTHVKVKGIQEYKSWNLGKESEEILINKTSKKFFLNQANASAPDLNNVNNEGDSLELDVPCEQNGVDIISHPKGIKKLVHPPFIGVSNTNKKIIPQDSINVCIKCINNYSNKYIAKLLDISHINPKQIDTYIILDSNNKMILSGIKTKIRPKKIDIHKCYAYPEKEKSQIPDFFFKLFNNRVASPILIFLRRWGIVYLPRFLKR